MSKKKLTGRLSEESQFYEIDKSFSEVVLELEARGFKPATIAFFGASNLAEYGFCRSRSGTAVCATLLGGMLTQFERRAPSEEGEGEEDFEEISGNGKMN